MEELQKGYQEALLGCYSAKIVPVRGANRQDASVRLLIDCMKAEGFAKEALSRLWVRAMKKAGMFPEERHQEELGDDFSRQRELVESCSVGARQATFPTHC